MTSGETSTAGLENLLGIIDDEVIDEIQSTSPKYPSVSCELVVNP